MFVRSFLILAALVIGIAGWVRPEKQVPVALTALVIVLLAVTAIGQLWIEWQNARDRARSRYSGTLKPGR